MPSRSPDPSREVFPSTKSGIHPISELVCHATVRLYDDIPRRQWAAYLSAPTHFFCRYQYDPDKKSLAELPDGYMLPPPMPSAVRKPSRPLQVLDLYAGAGGFSVGLEAAGLNVAVCLPPSLMFDCMLWL